MLRRSVGNAPAPPLKSYKVRLTNTLSLTDLIAPIASAQGLALVRVQMNGAKSGQTLQVMAEDPATGQLTLEQCEKLSRALSAMLDEVDPIEHEYALEVSSPGIDRPLTRLGDYAKWAGHDARVRLTESVDGRVRLHGTIAGVTGENVDFTVPTVGPVRVPFAKIESAKLVLTNKLIAASRPLDFGDAETIELPSDGEEDED
jgi:ribosome maturation factor RimP